MGTSSRYLGDRRICFAQIQVQGLHLINTIDCVESECLSVCLSVATDHFEQFFSLTGQWNYNGRLVCVQTGKEQNYNSISRYFFTNYHVYSLIIKVLNNGDQT